MQADQDEAAPVLHEETDVGRAGDEEAAVRSAEEERNRLFVEAEARSARERQKEVARLMTALDLLDYADPLLLSDARQRRAIRGARLLEQRATKPSLGGLLPQQMEQIQREEASREQGWRNEQMARERWVEDQEDVIKRLCAGQSPENAAQIRAQFNAQKARG